MLFLLHLLLYLLNILSGIPLKFLFYKLKRNGIKDAKILQIIGMMTLTKEYGFRYVKQILGNNTILLTRLKKEISLIENDNNYLYDVFKFIKHTLTNMETVRT